MPSFLSANPAWTVPEQKQQLVAHGTRALAGFEAKPTDALTISRADRLNRVLVVHPPMVDERGDR
jgi:hypothetical protein